jgi:hypothetical protein
MYSAMHALWNVCLHDAIASSAATVILRAGGLGGATGTAR